MFPWTSIWCPIFHYPWSGAVAQRIEPDLSWFFDAIPESAGDGTVEGRAFKVASYGAQLGLISEVLLHLADAGSVDPEQAKESHSRLKEIRQQIDALETEHVSLTTDALIAQLQRLKADKPSDFERVLAVMRH